MKKRGDRKDRKRNKQRKETERTKRRKRENKENKQREQTEETQRRCKDKKHREETQRRQLDRQNKKNKGRQTEREIPCNCSYSKYTVGRVKNCISSCEGYAPHSYFVSLLYCSLSYSTFCVNTRAAVLTVSCHSVIGGYLQGRALLEKSREIISSLISSYGHSIFLGEQSCCSKNNP